MSSRFLFLFFFCFKNIFAQDPILVGQISAANQRITNVNTTVVGHTAQINQLGANLGALQNYVNTNIPQLASQISGLTTSLDATNAQVAQNSALIDQNAALIAALDAALNAQQGMITKLQSINQVWQSNFKVVNKTFAELRKKVKFVVSTRLVLAQIG